MKLAAVWLVASAACIACVGGALYLAVEGKDGWGWFLFVGLLLAPTGSSKEGQ